ncbi:MAG: phosphatidylglycerol lysyltransferase domain-containing protein [Candidatus Diapherotrites archaeon]
MQKSLDSSILNIEGVSELTAEDKELFDKFYKNEDSVDFSNSWFYTIQSTIFGAYKYYDGKTLISFTTKTPEETLFSITAYLGKNALEKAFDLAKELKKTSKKQVVFKNLTSEQSEKLKKLGCEDYRKGDYWNNFYKYDDDTFPEIIIDLQELVPLKGNDLKTLRYRVNSFYKNDYKVEDYSAKYSKDVSEILTDWLELIKDRYKDYLKEDKIILHSAEIHKKFLELIDSGKADDYLSKIIFLNKKPVAFAIGYKISSKTFGLYTNVTSNDDVKGLSETIIYELLKEAHEKGYVYANLGGSEFKSLLKYKDKFKPTKHLQKTHVVLY